MKKEKLISALIERAQQHLNVVEEFMLTDIGLLNFKSNPEKWSVLECIEHLNLYGDFYNPEFNKRIVSAKKSHKPNYRPSFLGNYFEKSMLPKEKLNKMKTFTNKNPHGSTLNKSHLERFIHQQQEFISILNKSRNLDLEKTKCNLTLGKYFKLRLGDTLRFVSAHNERHIQQAISTLKKANE